jgi:hypothetical protein
VKHPVRKPAKKAAVLAKIAAMPAPWASTLHALILRSAPAL